MSVRLLTVRLVKHGRYILHSYWRRDIHINIREQNTKKARTRFSSSTSSHLVRNGAKNAVRYVTQGSIDSSEVAVAASSVPRSGIFRFGQHARKLFIDNVLNRITTTYSEELRQRATKKLFYGDSAQFFALVGVSLASGAGVLTKEDELEGVCWEIREAASRLQSSWDNDGISGTFNADADFNIGKLDVGPPIAKGCAAVVYAASFKDARAAAAGTPTGSDTVNNAESTTRWTTRAHRQRFIGPELMSPIQNISRFLHNFGGSVDNLNVYNDSSAAATFVAELVGQATEQQTVNQMQKIVDDKNTVEKESVFSGASNGLQNLHLDNSNASIHRYPLALKMMFNYDIQSNAFSILRAMYKETVPARQRYMNEASEEWEHLLHDQTPTLPPHPNIVCMFGFFCDEVGNFPEGHRLYPIAQPQRINPLGYGRNMSLYLLMKRYEYSLRGYLDTHELSARTKLLLLAQLLEAVAHINQHGIAHRDMKSDNILIELDDDLLPPVLVLSDFGCCLADKTHGLQLPYSTFDVDKGGNAALMPPEIINKMPGPFTVLNYNKTDLWACGAIAYEIFSMRNPFYSASGGEAAPLRSSDYKEDELPPINEDCPALVQQLIYNILNPNPSKRVSPDIAANVLQLYLWAPSNWLKSGGIPNSPEILQWLLSLSTKVMCEGRLASNTSNSAVAADCQLKFQKQGRRTYVEYLLICNFLSRARLRRIRGALNWIQNVI